MKITDANYHDIRERIRREGNSLLELVREIGFEEPLEVLEGLLNRLEDPFMFVIVGEVKSGKSSFINALLAPGKEICRVAASPMTDTIQQIVFGETEREEYLTKHLKRIYQPIPILREIAIVDTPGTNTIIEHHQEITERFVPLSDLIIFVFEAKNPYRQSAWDFFQFIKKDWHKKVIFVLQQKDLVNEGDLKVNLEGVKQLAREKGISDPMVFAVSALREIEGETGKSGYEDLQRYIRKNVTGGKAPLLKLSGSVDTIRQIDRNISRGMEARQEQLAVDLKFRDEIDQTLSHQEKQTHEQVKLLIETILGRFDTITRRYGDNLHERLTFGSLLKKSFESIFSRKEGLKNWLERMTLDMESELRDGLSLKLGEGVNHIAENIQFMAKMVSDRIGKNPTILTTSHEIFSELAEKRAGILRELQDAFSQFLNKEENIYDASLLQKESGFSPDFAKGSGIAAIGIILAALTNGVVFDITGGVLTALGFVFAGVSIGLKRRKIERKYAEEIALARHKLEHQVEEKMKAYISRIKSRILLHFTGFDQYLEKEKAEIERIRHTRQEIRLQLEEIDQELLTHT